MADQQTHNRQESADIGLGMGSTVYLPIITEDMDTDLDSSLTESNMIDIVIIALLATTFDLPDPIGDQP